MEFTGSKPNANARPPSRSWSAKKQEVTEAAKLIIDPSLFPTLLMTERDTLPKGAAVALFGTLIAALGAGAIIGWRTGVKRAAAEEELATAASISPIHTNHQQPSSNTTTTTTIPLEKRPSSNLHIHSPKVTPSARSFSPDKLALRAFLYGTVIAVAFVGTAAAGVYMYSRSSASSSSLEKKKKKHTLFDHHDDGDDMGTGSTTSTASNGSSSAASLGRELAGLSEREREKVINVWRKASAWLGGGSGEGITSTHETKQVNDKTELK